MMIQFKHLLRQVLPCLVIGLLFLAGYYLSKEADKPNFASLVKEAHKPKPPIEEWIPETPAQPEYIGNGGDLRGFIEKNLHYPEGDSAEGLVTVKFTITLKGKVVEPYIARGLSPATNKEALRLVRLLKYKPLEGYLRYTPVVMHFPIKFRRKRK